METNKEYDQHMEQFYSDTYRGLSLKHVDSNYSIKTLADNIFLGYSDLVNKNIASELLATNMKNSNSLVQLLDNQPKMYWKTNDGEKLLRNLAVDFLNEVLKKYTEEQMITKNSLLEGMGKVIDLANKIAPKNSDLAGKLIRDFDSYFVFSVADQNKEFQSLETKDTYREAVTIFFEDVKKQFPLSVPLAYEPLVSVVAALRSREHYQPTEFNITEPKRIPKFN
jgi:uncharacterized membrane protein YheB (UPF0754 family)